MDAWQPHKHQQAHHPPHSGYTCTPPTHAATQTHLWGESVCVRGDSSCLLACLCWPLRAHTVDGDEPISQFQKCGVMIGVAFVHHLALAFWEIVLVTRHGVVNPRHRRAPQLPSIQPHSGPAHTDSHAIRGIQSRCIDASAHCACWWRPCACASHQGAAHCAQAPVSRSDSH